MCGDVGIRRQFRSQVGWKVMSWDHKFMNISFLFSASSFKAFHHSTHCHVVLLFSTIRKMFTLPCMNVPILLRRERSCVWRREIISIIWNHLKILKLCVIWMWMWEPNHLSRLWSSCLDDVNLHTCQREEVYERKTKKRQNLRKFSSKLKHNETILKLLKIQNKFRKSSSRRRECGNFRNFLSFGRRWNEEKQFWQFSFSFECLFRVQIFPSSMKFSSAEEKRQ